MFLSNACCFRNGQLKQFNDGEGWEKQKHFIQAKTLEKIDANQNENKTKNTSRKSNPPPYRSFCIRFFTKKVPLSIPCLELCIPFDCCKSMHCFFFFYIEINLKNSLYTDVVLFFFSFLPPYTGRQ